MTIFLVEKRVITPQQPANGIPASPATTPIPELKGSPTGKKVIPRRTTSAQSSPLAQNKLQPLKGKSIEKQENLLIIKLEIPSTGDN